MEIVWTLLLTACFSDTDCRYQNVQFFDTKEECIVLKTELDVTRDGNWDTVYYQCRPYRSLEA